MSTKPSPPSSFQGPPEDRVQRLFSDIAPGYDRANDWMTLGLVHRWRAALIRWSQIRPGDAVLDCATGTGDVAILFKKRMGSAGSVIGTDFNRAMLEYAPDKARAAGVDVTYEWADVTRLPYADGRFDVASISYGIRNVSDPVRGLAEMARVCKPGGRVMVLETGTPEKGLRRRLIDWHFRRVVPVIGGWITGKRYAYEHLQNTSAVFPAGEAFLDLMHATKAFECCEYKSFLGGASYLYRGTVKG